jgi:preprotein translocase subunit YajC
MEALAYAAEAAPAGGVQGILGNPLVVMIPIFVIMYMLLIRPQKKKQDQHKEMLKNLEKGDKVITSSGLYGIVVKVSEKDVILEVADKVNLRFSLGAIGSVREREEKKEAD